MNLKRCMKLVGGMKSRWCVALVSVFAGGCASNPMLGEWQYQHQATSIGLELKADEECNLSLDRFVKKNLKKSCRYEPNAHASANNQGKSYLVFLRDEEGHCDVFADFEFLYEEDPRL